MEINFKEVNNNDLYDYLNKFLLEKSKETLIVFGSIDNNTYERLEGSIKEFNRLYIGISNKYTTKKMLEELSDFENVFYQNNNNYREMLKENLIIKKELNYTKILIIPFELKEEIIQNANNNVILIKIKNDETNIEEINAFAKKYELNKLGYLKLTKGALKDLEKDKAFRNEKADTLDKEIDKDEIIKSFRTIQGIENKDEFLKMVEVHSKIKNKGFLKNEIEFTGLDDKNNNDLIQNFDLGDNDIEFE